MTDEDRAIQDKARRFVDEELIPHELEAEMNAGQLPRDVIERQQAKLRELGLWSINMPRDLGGTELTSFQQVLVSEQIGRVTNGLGWVLHTGPEWAVGVFTADQVDRYLKPMVAGDKRECYAITEPNAGSDVDAIEATARREGGDYLLNGTKWHVTSFNKAEVVFFQAKLAGGPKAGSHALFIVDIPSEGLRMVRAPAYSHTYADQHAILEFEDVRVPAANLIGDEGGGMDFTYAWFRYERLMIAARCCGAAERLIEEATAFAKERVQFGQPIMSYQAIQHMLADSLTELWAARLEGVDLKVQHAHCSMAKLYASEMANRVADRAVQIFGGRGYMRENVAERFYRELRVDRIWEGTSEIQRNIIADQLAKRGAGTLAG
ncbi:MAG: acyl-CoA dehydrogenase [Actinobacteria bacterium]|nr:MAG: acyl-CoA dehydrogenase [Actinomycetota bacterium]